MTRSLWLLSFDLAIHFSTVRNATVNSNRYNDEMSSSTSTPSQQLIALLQTVKTKIANGLSSDERAKIAKGIEQTDGEGT